MRDIAEKNDLVGYEYSDYYFFRNLLFEFKKAGRINKKTPTI